VAGLSVDSAARMAAAEVPARGSVPHGASRVSVRILSDTEAVTCEVSDDAPVDGLLHRRGGVPTDAHDGLWHVNQDCDLVQLRSGNGRTVVRILSWK
jgi:hypothetical protein